MHAPLQQHGRFRDEGEIRAIHTADGQRIAQEIRVAQQAAVQGQGIALYASAGLVSGTYAVISPSDSAPSRHSTPNTARQPKAASSTLPASGARIGDRPITIEIFPSMRACVAGSKRSRTMTSCR